MSVSISIMGIKPINEKFNAMKTIYDTCVKMGIKPPKEVDDFFVDAEPFCGEYSFTDKFDKSIGHYETIEGIQAKIEKGTGKDSYHSHIIKVSDIPDGVEYILVELC